MACWIRGVPIQAQVSPESLLLRTPAEEGGSVESLINRGQLDRAERLIEARFAAQGGTARNFLLRGVLEYRRDRYEQALADLRKSFALDELDPSTSKALGLCLVKLGRNDLAETFFEISTELAPRDFLGHYYLGLNRYTAKRFEDALGPLQLAVDIRPDSVEALTFLGRSHEALGDTERSAKLYLAALELTRKQPFPSSQPPLLLATMLVRQQQMERAKDLLLEALMYDEEAPLGHYWLGLVHEQSGDLAAAARALERAAELMPADHRPHYALARIHRRTGSQRLAAESLRRFRELRRRSESETY